MPSTPTDQNPDGALGTTLHIAHALRHHPTGTMGLIDAELIRPVRRGAFEVELPYPRDYLRAHLQPISPDPTRRSYGHRDDANSEA